MLIHPKEKNLKHTAFIHEDILQYYLQQRKIGNNLNVLQ